MPLRVSWWRMVGVAGVVTVGILWLRSLAFGPEGSGRDGTRLAAGVSGSRGTALVVYEGVPLHPGRRRDDVAPVDHPVFAATPPNSAALSESDWVIGVHRGGMARAYPLWILSRREIVNDHFGVEPICVTYCPLSASAAVFRAGRGAGEDSFGNEGALYECNLVMYDRATGSLWYQLRGQAIHGPREGEMLSMVPAEVVRWGDWRGRHPQGTVLVGDAKAGRFFRVSDGDSLGGASTASAPGAPVSRMDSRLPVMERVIGFRVAGRGWCVSVERLKAWVGGWQGRHRLPGDEPRWLVLESGGRFRVQGGDGEDVPLIPAYWFAWQAAFPSGGVITNLPGG